LSQSSSPDLLAAALGWASAGYAVFPVHSTNESGGCSCNDGGPCRQEKPSPGKHPRTHNGWKDATLDPAVIRTWWQRWPDANIGIATGEPSGVFVLDIDGPIGRGSLAELEVRNGPLPPTRTVATGREDGGEHRWFRMPENHDIRNSTSKVGKKLDVRGTGGYVVAPPSLHASGARYQLVDDRRPVEAPAWVVELATAKRTETPAAQEPLPTPPRRPPSAAGDLWESAGADGRGGSPRQRVLGMIRAAAERIRTTPEGQRNDAVNAICFSVGGFLDAGGVSLDEASAELEPAAVDAEQPRSLVRRALEDGRRHRRELPPDQERLQEQAQDRPLNREPATRPDLGPEPPPYEDAQPAQVRDERPEIHLSPDVHRTARRAVRALAQLPTVFRHLGHLAYVPDHAPDPKDRGRVIALTAPALVTRLSEAAVFAHWVEDRRRARRGGKAPGDWVRVAPPSSLAKSIADAGDWPEVRPLEGVTRLPPLRPDASVATSPGYDGQTRLYYAPRGEVPVVPPEPDLEDARAAYEALCQVVANFPFDTPADEAAWVAGALTPIAWPMFRGATPGILVEAPGRDIGKSRLASLGVMIAAGVVFRRRWPTLEEEQAKTLATVASRGETTVLFDNVRGSLGGATLDAYLTAGGEDGGYQDRLLGANTDIEAERVPMPWFSCNNPQLHADTSRRVLSVRLFWRPKPGEPSRASARQDLPELPGPDQAPRLWALCATILRAWVLAGRPQPAERLPPFNSYERWCKAVRAAVYWVSGLDPCATRGRLDLVDSESLELAALLRELEHEFSGGKFQAREAVHRAKNNDALAAAMREAGCADKKSGVLDTVMVGHRFRRMVDNPDDDGRRLERVAADRKDVVEWRISRDPT
jgi:hypothetical protein